MLINLLNSILYSNEKRFRYARTFIFYLVILSAALQLFISFHRFDESFVIVRDLTQDYLMGKAIREGVNPYKDIPELSRIFLGSFSPYVNQHPSPHSPIIALIFTAFAGIPLLLFSQIWACLSIICVGLSIFIITRQEVDKEKYFKIFLFCFASALLSLPFEMEMIRGQFSAMYLLALTLAWYSYRKDCKLTCGLFLGFCLCTKYFAWPFVLFYLLRRQWKVLSAAACVFISSFILSYYVLGAEIFHQYYSIVLPQVNEIWSNDIRNISLYSSILKILLPPIYILKFYDGGSFPVHILTETLNLTVNSAAIFLSMAVIGLVVFQSYKNTDDQKSFLKLCSISVIANPITWMHYGMVLLLPFAVVVSLIASKRRSLQLILPLFLMILFLFVDFAIPPESLPGVGFAGGEPYQASLSSVLITNVPTFIIVIVAFIL